MTVIKLLPMFVICFIVVGCNTVNSQSIASDFSSPCNVLGDYFQSFRYTSSDNYENQRLIVEDINKCIDRLNVNGHIRGLDANITNIKIIEK